MQEGTKMNLFYRIIEDSFDEFQSSYPDQFEDKYGYLRTEVMKALYSFLDCGIPENGMARVRCEEYGVFYEQRNRSTPVIAEIFRTRLLTLLLKQSATLTTFERPLKRPLKIP